MTSLRGTISILMAPWIYAAGKLFSSPRLMVVAAEMDIQSLRPWHDMRMKGDKLGPAFGRHMIAAKLCAVTTDQGQDLANQLFTHSKSQLLQDIVCALANNNKRQGFFVEVGVGNGTDFSNTFMLEKHLGWKGILAEPNRASHQSISENRTAFLEKRAVYNQNGQRVAFTEVVSDGDFSGISTHHNIKSNQNATSYDVETITLDTLLDECKAPAKIDFMSIDTEGSELQILDGLSLDKWQFGMLAIEHNFNLAKQAELDQRLAPFGYRRVFPAISEFDAWYFHSSVDSKNFR
jgi:FkbM family methyltransferase